MPQKDLVESRRSARLHAKSTGSSTPTEAEMQGDDDNTPATTSPVPTPQREGKEQVIDDVLDASADQLQPVIETPGAASSNSAHAAISVELIQQLITAQSHMVEKLSNRFAEHVTTLVGSLAPSKPDDSAVKTFDWRTVGKNPPGAPPSPISVTGSPLPTMSDTSSVVSTETTLDQLLERCPNMLRHLTGNDKAAILGARTHQAGGLAFFSALSKIATLGELNMQCTLPEALGVPVEDMAFNEIIWQCNPGRVSTHMPGDSLAKNLHTVIKNLRYTRTSSTFSGEGTSDEIMASYMDLTAKLKMLAPMYPAVCFLLGVRQLLMDDTPDWVILMSPGCPCPERHAAYTLLTELLSGKALTVATSCSNEAATSGDIVWHDGIMAMICIIRTCIILGSPTALVEIEAQLRSVRFQETGDPEPTLRWINSKYSMHEMLSPVHSKMSLLAKAQYMWDAVPGSHDSKWGLLKMRLYENLSPGQRYPSVAETTAAVRDFHHFYAAAQAGPSTTALKQISSSTGKLEPLQTYLRQSPTLSAHLAGEDTHDGDETGFYMQPSRQGGDHVGKPRVRFTLPEQDTATKAKEGIQVWRGDHPKSSMQKGTSGFPSVSNKHVNQQRQAQRENVSAARGAGDRCFNCKGFGHQSKVCPSPRAQQTALVADDAETSDEDDCPSEEETASSAVSPGFLSSTSATSSQDTEDYASYLHHGVVNGRLTSEAARAFFVNMQASGTKQTYDDARVSFIGLAEATELDTVLTDWNAPHSASTLSDSDDSAETVHMADVTPGWMNVPRGVVVRRELLCDQHGEYFTYYKEQIMPGMDDVERRMWVFRNMMCMGKHVCGFNMLTFMMELYADNKRCFINTGRTDEQGNLKPCDPLDLPHHKENAYLNFPKAYQIDLNADQDMDIESSAVQPESRAARHASSAVQPGSRAARRVSSAAQPESSTARRVRSAAQRGSSAARPESGEILYRRRS
jgi:hypothetical protein